MLQILIQKEYATSKHSKRNQSESVIMENFQTLKTDQPSECLQIMLVIKATYLYVHTYVSPVAL